MIDILRARARIVALRPANAIRCMSAWLSGAAGTRVSLKLESAAGVGTRSSRGARSTPSSPPRARRTATGRALVTASAGNHGRAPRAIAAETLRIAARRCSHRPTRRTTKLDAIRRHGRRCAPRDATTTKPSGWRRRSRETTGGTFISPYNDPDVIAGAATIAVRDLRGRAADVDTSSCRSGAAG